jgi:hypothetical protein
MFDPSLGALAEPHPGFFAVSRHVDRGTTIGGIGEARYRDDRVSAPCS